MNARSLFRVGSRQRAVLTVLGRVGALLLPAGLLFVAALRNLAEPNLNLWLGTTFQVLVCLLTFLTRQNGRQPLGPAVVTLYIIALGWLWLGTPAGDDWYLSLAKALLLVVPLLCFSLQVLAESGATALRRAAAGRPAGGTARLAGEHECLPHPARGQGAARGGADRCDAGAGAVEQPAPPGAGRRPGRPGVPQELETGPGRDRPASRAARERGGGSRQRRHRPRQPRRPPPDRVAGRVPARPVLGGAAGDYRGAAVGQ